jgi:glycosyltransferase involved in cell wall biosynthesis
VTNRRVRLGILATHPIQYHAPLYRALAARPEIELTVYYAHRPTATEQGVGFGVPFEWDIDLTSGYDHIFLQNAARANRDRFGDYDTPEIGAIIEQGSFDAFLVHGWQARSYWQAMRACWRTRTPVYVRGDSQLGDDRLLIKRAAKRLIYPFFMRRFAACLAVGVRSDAYFRYYGARRVVRAPHFVDNAAFAAGAARARAERAAVRTKWGISPSATVALFAGKMSAKKRPLDLIAAVARTPGVHALIVGDGALKGEAERVAGGAVTFAGFRNQSDMPEAYAVSDVLVLPSDRQETWGLVVNEAMASRVPAIVSDAVGCAPDLIVPGSTGWTYPAGDVAALSAALGRMVTDPGASARMGAAAARHIAAFSVEAAADGVVRAVTTL